uniref:Uncharacterized protein n=1 Tax=Anguilla anguilla TaxID=7936 RepID=A0A0E9S6S4_ANGAN
MLNVTGSNKIMR